MLELPLILLQRDDDNGPMRFLGILIIIAIFVIGNLVQWLQKYQEQKRKQDLQRRAQGQAAPPPLQRPTIARPSPRQTPQPRRPAPAPALAQRQATLQRKPQAPPRLPPLPQPARAEPRIAAPAPTPSHDISATEIGAAPTRKEATGRQRGFLRAVLNPQSLKQAYILTELLQPPVALRDARHEP